jgi:hypothetical protein
LNRLCGIVVQTCGTCGSGWSVEPCVEAESKHQTLQLESAIAKVMCAIGSVWGWHLQWTTSGLSGLPLTTKGSQLVFRGLQPSHFTDEG